MARGRKRKRSFFVPQPWIHNSSSEDEHRDHGGHQGHGAQGNDVLDNLPDGKDSKI